MSLCRQFVPAASWPSNETDTDALTRSGRLALQNRAPVVEAPSAQNTGRNAGPVVVACPLFQQEQLFGVVVLVEYWR